MSQLSDEEVPAGRLGGLGWDDGWADLLAAAEGRGAVPGRVVRTHRFGFDVALDDDLVPPPPGTVFAITPRRIRDPLAAPATGDWVGVSEPDQGDEWLIHAVLPRRTAVVRRDPSERANPQVLAANTDVVAVVHAADRPPNHRRLERFLAVAHGSGADVVAVLSKCDLPGAEEVGSSLEEVLGGTPLLRTATPSGAASAGFGVAALDALTEGRRTLVLLGESGAGKSSLVNAVLGIEAQAIGGVREGDHKGRHTTTRRELIALPTGGALLDTPGIRAIGLWPTHVDLDATFDEIRTAAEECRFGDCSHQNEPGCGVRSALDDGLITEERFDSYRQLSQEVSETAEEVVRRDWR